MMMGRPVRYTPKEIETAVLRGRYMCSIAQRELSIVDAEVGNTPAKGIIGIKSPTKIHSMEA